MLRVIIPLLALLITPVAAYADCSSEQTWCNTQCEAAHLGDDAAIAGCRSKCIAQRAVCSTKSGAETVFEAGKEAVDKTGSFIKGLTK